MNRWRWFFSRLRYLRHGLWVSGQPGDLVWYFAFGANMHDSAFRERRGMRPLEWRPGRLPGFRLRFNLEGRPRGKAALDNDGVLDLIDKREKRGLLPPQRAAEGRKSLENFPDRSFFEGWLRRFLREGRISSAA